VLLASWVLRRYKPAALIACLTLLPAWFVVSLGLLLLFERPA
jgi:hypothetical protein